MITEVHENAITDYLVARELSLDILVEIRDHMISQISDMQFNENISFEEAFSKVKKSWNGEFEMVHYPLFYPAKIPLIARRIIHEKYKGLFKKSLLVGALAFAVNLLLIFISGNQKQYDLFFHLLNGSFVVAAILIWILNYKIWKYIKADFKYKGKSLYTMYQQNLGLMVVCASSMTQVAIRHGHYAYQFFREQNYNDVPGVLMTLMIPFVLQVALLFALFNFIEHKKNLLKMQEFLKAS
ncbi:hypothetical protein [Chryseobacterium aureum]|uniref:hypothetical protein n=1 Tax=Chryseobacterium aureum TaxID=2497456 RepID=UPI000F87F518|nr:hypothetical protein [Chryseobacterium aureum]